MIQGYPPYNDREGYSNQPPTYQNQAQNQWQQPHGYPPQNQNQNQNQNHQQQQYPAAPPPSNYYPAEKQEYYPPSPQPPYGSSANSQTPYPPHNQNGHPIQPPYGPPSPQSQYADPPPSHVEPAYRYAPYQGENSQYQSPQPQYNQPSTGYPPQPRCSNQGPPQLPYSSYPGAPPPQTNEERGLMGALGGAAAGGFAGHKMGHGIIGTLGGAFAGHKLEDAYKTHNRTPTPTLSPRPPPIYNAPQPQYAPLSPQVQNQGVSAGGLALQGNFSYSSTSITLDHDYDLIASVAQPYGGTKLSSVALNQYIMNDNGNFRWVSGGGNFAGSARNVRLIENGTVLEAELANVNGQWNGAKTWLNEKIGNVNGELRYIG